MHFRPLHDRVVVERMDQTERTASGLIVPDVAKEKPSRGIVLAVGPGIPGEPPLDVKPGDEVLFGKYAGQDLTIEGKPVILMREAEILAVVEPETVQVPEGALV